MTSILTDWGKRCIEKLIKRVIAEARFVFCLSCIANEFDEEIDRLKPELETLEQRVKEAKGRNKYIAANVVSWKEEVDKLIQEDTKAKQTCPFGFCPDCIWQCKRGKQLANDTEKIKGLIEKADKFGNIEVSRPPPGVEHKSSQDYISFESRLSKYNELLDALRDDNNYITGLQGMAGTGKTTMAIKVGKELKESGQFTYVIVTTVSPTPDIKKIQDDIAGSLGLKWEDCNESDRPGKLWDRLTKGEKILLILDDVWDQDLLLDFGAIGIPKRDNHKGCRVLVTTRSKQLSNIMNFDKSIELNPLSEEDAWIMFKRYANISESSSKDVIDRGRKIAKECKQLPVTIAVIASSLKGQQHRVEKWEATLTSLKINVPTDGIDLVEIYKCLKVSYDNMKDPKAKELFLLCSLFREDEEISIEVLTRIGIGSGLFGKDCGTYDEARKKVVTSKYDLVDSSLLLDVDEKHVKMRGLVRGMAQLIASKEIRVVNLSKKKSLVEWDVNIRYSSFEGKKMDLFSCKFDGSKLKTLIVNIERDEDCVCRGGSACVEGPNSFFENIVGLQVLNLSNKSINLECPTLSLPRSITLLTDIRSLLVERVDLGDISILGSLQSLETLDLDHCHIEELPREIENLKELRLLNLEHCEIRSNNPFEVIQNCTSLEELYFCNSFNNFVQEITLPKLERYRLTDGFSKMNNSLSKCVSIQQDYFSEGTLKQEMKGIELLRLERINKGWSNLMPEIVPIDQGMNDLIELHLKYNSQLQYLIYIEDIDSQAPKVFSKLAALHLERMDKLQELCNGPISFDSMNSLEELTIECCQHLQSLFKSSLNPCNLKNVTLKSCSKLVSVFNLSTSGSLLLLESLEIIDCTKLENIFSNDTNKEIVHGDNDNKNCNSMFSRLKVIKINCCRKLKYIFGQHQDFTLASLKEMVIGDSPNFIDIFPEFYHSTLSSIQGSSNSISKPQTHLEPIEPSIFSLESNSYCLRIWEHTQWLSRSTSYIACNVKVMTLVNVSKKKSVLMLSIAPKVLWESLTVKNCVDLEQIIVDIGENIGGGDVFPKLKELYVENCDKMEYIVGHIKASDDHQNHNEVTHIHLPALESLKLCRLPSLIGMCTKSCHTTFPPSVVLQLIDCSQADIKSFGEFTVPSSISRYHDSTISKEYDDGQISSEEGSQEITQTKNQGSLNDDTLMKVSSEIEELFTTDDDVADGTEVQATTEHELTSVDKRCRDKNGIVSNVAEIKNEQTAEAKQKFVASISGLKRTSEANSQGLLNKQSTRQQCLMDQQHLIGEIDTTVKHSQEYGDGQRAIPSLSISTKDPLTIEDVDLEDSQKTSQNNNQESKGCDNGNENPSVETTKDFDVGSKVQASSGQEMTSSQEVMGEESMNEQSMTNPQDSVGEIDATIKPSQGVKEVGDGKICIPSISIVNTEPPPTKDDDIGDSQKTIAMEDIIKLIEEDPLFALEKLLIGQVSISSIRILLQELKSLMDSSSDLDHLISNQESKSKLFSLFSQLNQHQGLLPSHVKEFIEKVQTYFIDNIIKYTTFQQVLKKHNQLLDSKTDLVNKLWSAYITQTRIDHEISTANARIEELSLQIDEHTKKLEDIENQRDDLKSVVNRFNVQKNKLKAECTAWAQQSKEILSALASSEVDVREAERARNLATEGFANLKSSFPTF